MESSEQALELLHQLRRCGHYLQHHWSRGRASQNRTLRILAGHGEMTQRQLQDLLGIQQGSLSELVKKLEVQGLIVREREQNDQRQMLIRITDAGRQQNQLNHAQRLQQSRELVAALSGEERRQLMALLEKLYNSWNEGAGQK